MITRFDPKCVIRFPAGDGTLGYLVAKKDIPWSAFDIDQTFWLMSSNMDEPNWIKALQTGKVPSYYTEYAPTGWTDSGGMDRYREFHDIAWIPADIVEPLLGPQFNEFGEIAP